MKKLLILMFVSSELFSQDSLVFDYFKRYKYFEGDQNLEFYVKRKDIRIYHLESFIPKDKDSIIVKAGKVFFGSAYVLSKIPLFIHQGCKDEKCREIKVRTVLLDDSADVEINKNGYLRLIKDGGVPRKMIPIGGRQILYCPLVTAELFRKKITLRETIKKAL